MRICIAIILLNAITFVSLTQIKYRGKTECPTGENVDLEACSCRENEEYTSICVSAATCENPHLTTCLQKTGCNCKKGLIRDIEIDECVPIEECPQTEPKDCKNGEVFTYGSGCLATCSDPNPVNCNKPHRSGCFCPPGQLRNDFNNYECILPQFCPK